METYSDELSEYIRSVVRAVKAGFEGSEFEANEPIVLELSIVNSKRPDGGFDIFVVKGRGKYSSEQISKIRLSIKKRQASIE